MKNLLRYISMTALVLMAYRSEAQISIGAKAGVNLSQLAGLSTSEVKAKALFGFHVGGFVHLRIGALGIQPEILYSTQGAKLEKSTTSENLKINYFNVPVMFKFNLISGFYLETGPQFGFATSAKFGDDDIKNTIKSSDFSWGAGLGLQGHSVGIGARYNVGISKLGETTTSDIQNVDYKNGVLQVSLYVKIFGK